MEKREVKRTVEEVVRVEYVAEDGTVFRNEDECRKYEESALFVVRQRLKRLNKKYASQYSLFDSGYDDNEIEIFDIQTQEDLDNLKKYLHLTLSMHKSYHVKGCLEYFDNVTTGHEVIVFWGCDKDWCNTFGDGSLEAYIDVLRENYRKIVNPEPKQDKE